MPWWMHARYRAIKVQISLGCRITSAAREGSVKKLLILVGLVALTASAPLCALAQTQSGDRTQSAEKMLVGRVQSVDESGTELTLDDGTKLLTPLGAQLNAGALEKGMLVVALYQEQDDGRKVLTSLSRGRSEPVPEAPKQPQ
jgi:Protein of unknown function (DUF1344)